MQFQAVCSKGSKKLTLSLTTSDITEARNILHKQGYSIIEIKEIIDSSVLQEGNFFYFDILVNGVVQSGKIQSNDIFKAYRKLVSDLKYNVAYIYTTPNATEEEKIMVTAKVKDGYRMYLKSIGEQTEEETKKMQNEDEMSQFSPQVIRELEKYAKIIEETIDKVQSLLVKNHEVITLEQKSLLERIELELVQIKGTKNAGKIQTTLEESLKQIGEVEVEILKKGMIKEKQKFLEETNNLLKGIGSDSKIQTEEEKQSTIEYKIQSFFGKVFSGEKDNKKNTGTLVKTIDKNSFIYFKNKRELDIYKKSASKNDMAIIKAFFTFKFTLMRRLLLKKRLLQQNIQIIKNRLNNRSISYTKLAKGVDYYKESFFSFFDSVGTICVGGLFFYSLIYITLTTLVTMGIANMSLDMKPILFLTLFSIFSAGLNFIRGWKSMLIIIPIMFFVFSFLSINF